MIKQYNRQKAVLYAQKWALSRNPKYYAFDSVGGDCTNYISQCLLAGGGVMNFDKYYGWFYNSQNSRSPSWASVEYLSRFLLQNQTLGPFAVLQQVDNLQIGDIIQLKQTQADFNHSLIISKIENGRIFICAHDNNSLDRPLSSYNFVDIKGLHISGIYV